MKKHNVRIVGGDYRRTPIPVIDAPGLRPTPDRVRETLYNWVSHFWGANYHDKTVLDLFAGPGALGFEAALKRLEEDLSVLIKLLGADERGANIPLSQM